MTRVPIVPCTKVPRGGALTERGLSGAQAMELIHARLNLHGERKSCCTFSADDPDRVLRALVPDGSTGTGNTFAKRCVIPFESMRSAFPASRRSVYGGCSIASAGRADCHRGDL